MDKNNRQHLLHSYKPEIALFTIAITLIGLLGARILGSIGLILFGLNAVRGVSIKEWRKQHWWITGLVWVVLFGITYFWSADKSEWNAHVQVKLPVLFLPLAFGILPPFSKRHIHYFTLLFFGLVFSGCCWSLFHFFHDPNHYVEGYGTSNLIPTPAYNDHISFSTLVATTVVWGGYQWAFWNGKLKFAGALLMSFFVVYLHILAAKTGLASLYLFLLAYIIYLLCSKNWKTAVFAICGLGLLLVIAFETVPTFHRRITYMKWVADQYMNGDRNGSYGDVGRLISYDIAVKIIKAHPVIGIGAGDMLDEMKDGYNKWYPAVQERDRLVPHNQFLTIALGAGIPTGILFTIWIFAPLRRLRRDRNSAFFLFMWLALLVPIMIDPFLEVQWGVLVYLLPLLWCRKIMLERTEQKMNDQLPAHLSS